MSRCTLRLTIDVTYDDDNEIPALRDQLLDVATSAMKSDWLTGDTSAIVVAAVPTVEVLA